LSQPANDCNLQSADYQQLIAQRDKAVAERDLAHAERDIAHAEKDKACAERDEARAERDISLREREIALRERDIARSERDIARSERDSACHERDLACAERLYQLDVAANKKTEYMETIKQLKCALQSLECSRDSLLSENRKLVEEIRRKGEMFSSFTKHQAHLHERVCNLEAMQSLRQSRTYVFVGSKGPPLKYIRNFANALFPEKPPKEKILALFDILYDQLKSFRNYVKKRMKPVIIPLVRMDTCREIRKHFSPWKILEVLDSSKQSLNQVSLF
jgi:hypothetical protein